MSEGTLGREGLIWAAAKGIAAAEGKRLSSSSNLEANAEREYVLTLLRQVSAAVDGKAAQ